MRGVPNKGTSIFDFAYKPQKKSVNFVINDIATAANITRSELLGKSRKANLVRARFVLCYILYEYAQLTYNEIAAIVGRDHSTIINAKRCGEMLVIENAHLRDYVEQLAVKAEWTKRTEKT